MSPGVALSLTLWRGAKVGHMGAAFIGLSVAATFWLMLFEGVYDEPSVMLGSLFIPFAPALQSALTGANLGPALRRPDTQPWAQRRLIQWVLALALPWWLALVVPAALLNQATYGATVWLWFSAVLAASLAVGLSLAWTLWLVLGLGLGGMVMLTSFSSGYWRTSALEAWLQSWHAPSLLLPLSGVLFAGAAVVMYKVRQALTGVIPSFNAHRLVGWTATASRSRQSATPRPGQLKGLLGESATMLDQRLIVAVLLALFIGGAWGGALIRDWLPADLTLPVIPLLMALMPANAFSRHTLLAKAIPPPRGLLVPHGLHRPTLLLETLRLYGNSSTAWGLVMTRACGALGLAWGMQWTLTETLALFAAIGSSVLAELSLIAVREGHSIRGSLRHFDFAVVGVMLALIVGSLNGSAEPSQPSLTETILLASALVALWSVLVIASQARRWRRHSL